MLYTMLTDSDNACIRQKKRGIQCFYRALAQLQYKSWSSSTCRAKQSRERSTGEWERGRGGNGQRRYATRRKLHVSGSAPSTHRKGQLGRMTKQPSVSMEAVRSSTSLSGSSTVSPLPILWLLFLLLLLGKWSYRLIRSRTTGSILSMYRDNLQLCRTHNRPLLLRKVCHLRPRVNRWRHSTALISFFLDCFGTTAGTEGVVLVADWYLPPWTSFSFCRDHLPLLLLVFFFFCLCISFFSFSLYFFLVL